MSSFSRQYSTASPVLAIQPQHAHQSPLSSTTFSREHSPASFGARIAEKPSTASAFQAGRKRARDEALLSPELIHARLPGIASESYQPSDGKAFSKKTAGHFGDAGFSGTPVHHNSHFHDVTSSSLRQSLQPPELRSRKSQRMDSQDSSTSPANTSSNSTTNCLGSMDNTASCKGLVIDRFTLHLGIGWRRISGQEHMQAAARGWARFIENHFALSNVKICLESKSLQSYLIEATEGYFLFAENLRQGRMVSKTIDGALSNLQQSPPVFDGSETLSMQRPNQSLPCESVADTEMKID
ncbi:hypothetical protein HIM_08602 [Hirsutella minnesotensis 3608]|uniref:Uncharacterized protein n=1 Tax=Hirsutella minnesotensis 3608 TaxID=1043627 RepID=A0A0F7ZH53_9HYPO|nr:hypothetical protein HIM_08602 [Hirsutella minnesotensis 3608]